MEFLSIRHLFYLINEMRVLVKSKEWKLCIWIIIWWSVKYYINHLSPCWYLLKARSPSAFGTDDYCLIWRRMAVGPTQLVVCPLTIWSRLNYSWVFCRCLPIFWEDFNPTSKDYWPITKVHWLKRVDPFWLQIYNWLQPDQ